MFAFIVLDAYLCEDSGDKDSGGRPAIDFNRVSVPARYNTGVQALFLHAPYDGRQMVTVEQLLGEDKPKRVLSPAGRMRQLFDQAARIPRGKQ
jgi:hypothetical protein